MKRALDGSSSSSAAKRADDAVICTIAIDFGTSGTGYAYSFTGSDTIEAKEPGGQEAKKALTNLLLNADGSFNSFGAEARRRYYDSESSAMNFFMNFKMCLESLDMFSNPVTFTANGKRFPLIEVISKTLQYVKEEALKETGRSLPDGLQAREVQWVLTVPAIWADGAKGFMRKAAYQAGLIDTEDSRRL